MAQPTLDVTKLIAAFYDERPDATRTEERVAFGTSGHRGSALKRSFNEEHIVAICAAIAEYRRGAGIDGPLFLGIDTHALSEPAYRVAVEVLAAGAVQLRVAPGMAATPTPVVSHAIVSYNRGRARGLADGIVITPSHNPPEDGGIKYNEPHGGPAGAEVTKWIEERANALLGRGGVERTPFARASKAANVVEHDYVSAYVGDLASVLDLDAMRAAKLAIGADPMGGSSLLYWQAIGERLGLDVEVVNPRVDPTFAFMPPDHDGKIRMDCSSTAAMAKLLAVRDRFDLACGNDPDADRHGIVTRKGGLMNPNHYLAVAVHYLLTHRGWPAQAGVGKTVVSSSLIDRVVASLGRRLVEVPVGFKWFVPGLSTGEMVFGGEESAGASFLRRDGQPWTTDKDGPLLCLLAVEIMARTGKDPSEYYAELTRTHGAPVYTRLDVQATRAQRVALGKLSPENVRAKELAGEPNTDQLTRAPGNNAAIGGLKVVAPNGWFAARPSGTEDIYKIYAESFRGPEHLQKIVAEAKDIVAGALG